jgi:hypothetical protein
MICSRLSNGGWTSPAYTPSPDPIASNAAIMRVWQQLRTTFRSANVSNRLIPLSSCRSRNAS